MFIHIPEDFLEYVNLLSSKGYSQSETTVIQKLAEEGLVQVLKALSQNGLGDPENMIEFLRNCERVPILFDLTKLRGNSKIGQLSEVLNISEDLCVPLLIQVGLITEGYYFLRHEVPDYDSDDWYREIVDSMPHDPDFESKEKVPEGTLVIEENEALDVYSIN